MISSQETRLSVTKTAAYARSIRILVILVAYTGITGFSIWLAYQLRFDFFVSGLQEEERFQANIWSAMLWIVPLKLAVLFAFRQHTGLLSYFGTPDLYRLARSVCVGSALLGIIRIQLTSDLIPPRGVILIDFVLSIVLLSGFRTACRILREGLIQPGSDDRRLAAYRIAIIGAGDVGASLAKDLLNKRGLGRMPVVFLDDDPSKANTSIHNVPVAGIVENLEEVQKKFNVEEAIIAMPSATTKRIGEIVSMLQRLHIKFVTVPSIDQMATGKVRLTRLRPIEIQDLLGRDQVAIEREAISDVIGDRIVVVTGAGGSIGSELCRQIGAFNPDRILLVDHSEFLLFEIEQELVENGYGGIILAIVGSILDEIRMRQIFGRFRPTIVFHAAAMKHVPMMEAQPSEAIKVNSIGTALLARLAVEFEVERFVMISTDKAINPTSVMGASKRLAEMYIQALAASSKEESTRFMAVRFGNVLGSSGSVVPTFNRQIAAGGPVKVTHVDVTRFFMTIPEAVGLVLQCGAQGSGGEIFVLDMGKPVRIVELAEQLIQLHGLRPYEDIDIEFVGLRPGEKLFEELQHAGEDTLDTQHPKILRFGCEAESIEEMKRTLETLEHAVVEGNPHRMKELLKLAVPEYRPYLD